MYRIIGTYAGFAVDLLAQTETTAVMAAMDLSEKWETALQVWTGTTLLHTFENGRKV